MVIGPRLSIRVESGNIVLEWPADIPAGSFTFLVFATPPGAFADGNVGPTDLTDLRLDVLQASP